MKGITITMKTSITFSCLMILILSSLTVGSPVNKLPAVVEMNVRKASDGSVLDTVKSTLGNIQSQLTSLGEHVSSLFRHHHVKRDVQLELEAENTTANVTAKPEHYFEDYEKQFLINQTMNLLKQMLLYNEYKESLKNNNTNVTEPATPTPPMGQTAPSVIGSTTTDGNRVDDVLQRKLRQLNAMSLEQVDRVFHNVKNAALEGYEDPSISSLCCQMG